jgi:hypothetical protein
MYSTEHRAWHMAGVQKCWLSIMCRSATLNLWHPTGTSNLHKACTLFTLDCSLLISSIHFQTRCRKKETTSWKVRKLQGRMCTLSTFLIACLRTMLPNSALQISVTPQQKAEDSVHLLICVTQKSTSRSRLLCPSLLIFLTFRIQRE